MDKMKKIEKNGKSFDPPLWDFNPSILDTEWLS
jgi:hypothetical protein